MTTEQTFNRDSEWLQLAPPVGLVVSTLALKESGLVGARQTPVDSAAAQAFIDDHDEMPALADPWAFFSKILGWRAQDVFGSPGGAPLPDDLAVRLTELATTLQPSWAARAPKGSEAAYQLLVRIEAPGINPEAKKALDGWEATPQQRFERLLRETKVFAGLMITDKEIRLIYAPQGETSGWQAFPIRALTSVPGRPILGGVKLLLDRSRFFGEPNQRLTHLLKRSREAQATVSTELSAQVLGALHELLRGIMVAEARSKGTLIAGLARSQPHHLYEGLLTVLMRLVFVLYAEDRDLIPSRTEKDARWLYDHGYSVRGLFAKLNEDEALNPDAMDDRVGGWGQLLALFRLIHKGHGSGFIRARGGKLFDPEAFPFIEGRSKKDDPATVMAVSDGCLLRILRGLMLLKGERLSYRALDVEAIGSVYETVMGFTVEVTKGGALAIKAGKNNKVPVFVDLDALLALKPGDRIKHIKTATTRALTQPIVLHALEPTFERLGSDATPEQILDLKVCDPAMGSGAFLVEACRQLGARLQQAWARWPELKPQKLPDDEDEELHAKRLVAQRCLYGVDRNPMATDLAKLSLWLATLARDHEFEFVDHALKTGDSLVGLSISGIAAANWDDSKPGLPLFKTLVNDEIEKALKARDEIRNAPDDVFRAIQEVRHRNLEQQLDPIRAMGDATIAAFFSEGKPRAREQARQKVESLFTATLQPKWDEIYKVAAGLQTGEHPVRPFHWQLEFPEVFARKNPGFDAIVGNPPFAGKNTVAAGNRAHYPVWLQNSHPGAHGNADLVAHFFRSAFVLLRKDGTFGLIATNTIGQGDTRATGLTTILGQGGVVSHATRRLKWPGEAAVVVSVVHVRNGAVAQPMLDGRPVRRISAYLVEGDLDVSPKPLGANAHKAFIGSYVLGMGFTFDDDAATKGAASSLVDMHRLIAKDPRNAERILPYVGGEEVNNDPRHTHRRFVIDFGDMSETQTRSSWPDLMEIVERLVKPERVGLPPTNTWNKTVAKKWWLWGAYRQDLNVAIRNLNTYLFVPNVSPHLTVSRIPSKLVAAAPHNVIAFEAESALAALQSRIHEVWARFFASTLEDRLQYTPSDCFATFPFPLNFETSPTLEAAGKTYHDHRAALMIARNEGLTKTYNRFHNPVEDSPDIVRLRELHDAMDRAVLTAYGWDDLAGRAVPEHLTEDTEDDHKYQGRYFWPAPVRDDVLARLLALNAARAEEERLAGLTPAPGEDEEASNGATPEDEAEADNTTE